MSLIYRIGIITKLNHISIRPCTVGGMCRCLCIQKGTTNCNIFINHSLFCCKNKSYESHLLLLLKIFSSLCLQETLNRMEQNAITIERYTICTVESTNQIVMDSQSFYTSYNRTKLHNSRMFHLPVAMCSNGCTQPCC